MALFILTENKEILNLIAEDFALEFSDIEALEEGVEKNQRIQPKIER